MSGKPAARQGDPTTCPLPGHGKPPIQSGSPDVQINSLPAARVGDPASCGQTITGAYSTTVFINGKNAATLGGTLSHGGVIVGGSGDVLIGDTVVAAPFIACTCAGRQMDQLSDSRSRALHRLAVHRPFR